MTEQLAYEIYYVWRFNRGADDLPPWGDLPEGVKEKFLELARQAEAIQVKEVSRG